MKLNLETAFAIGDWVDIVSGLYAGQNGKVVDFVENDPPVLRVPGGWGYYVVRIGFFKKVGVMESQLKRYEPGYL